MLTTTQNKIITHLLDNSKTNFSIRSLARDLKKSYALTYNNIKKLKKQEIIIEKSIPPAKLITLNKNTPKKILIDIETKKKYNFLKKNKWIEVMLNEINTNTDLIYYIIIIFGSYAKKTQTSKSDLDILIISPSKKEIKELEAAVQKTYTKVNKSLIIIDTKEFIRLIKNSNEFNIVNQALDHHIILYGIEQYYTIIKKYLHQ